MTRTRHPKRDLPEYVQALEGTPDTPCRDRPEEYIDFVSPPSIEDAGELCIECPIMAICDRNARWRKPYWGVWGGNVWIQGRRMRDTPDE